MPELVRLYITQCFIGFLIALAFTGLLIGLNVANLRHLIMAVQGGWLAVLMLVVFNTIVFAGVQFGIAVMRMAEPEDRDPRGGQRARRLIALRPVSVPAAARKR